MDSFETFEVWRSKLGVLHLYVPRTKAVPSYLRRTRAGRNYVVFSYEYDLEFLVCAYFEAKTTYYSYLACAIIREICLLKFQTIPESELLHICETAEEAYEIIELFPVRVK